MNYPLLARELLPHLKDNVILHPYFESDIRHVDVDVVNRAFYYRRTLVRRAAKSRDWRRWVFLHYGPHRLQRLLLLRGKIDQSLFMSIVGEVWNDESVLPLHPSFLGVALHLNRNTNTCVGLMTEREQAHLASLPDKVSVFRSHHDTNIDGICWTESCQVAMDISLLFGYTYITRATVDRSKIICYFDRRHQQEIIAWSSNCTTVSTELISSR
jgi:hypothetical protein